jgi:hypothetical protein
MSARSKSFKLTPPIVPENDLHQSVVQALSLLLLPPAEWFAYPAGHIALSGRDASKLARMGLRAGLPDILVVHRRIYGIEIKKADGKLSRDRVVRTRGGRLRHIEGQTTTFPRLQLAGMQIAIVRNVDEALAALEQWDVPLRRRAGMEGVR